MNKYEIGLWVSMIIGLVACKGLVEIEKTRKIKYKYESSKRRSKEVQDSINVCRRRNWRNNTQEKSTKL